MTVFRPKWGAQIIFGNYEALLEADEMGCCMQGRRVDTCESSRADVVGI